MLITNINTVDEEIKKRLDKQDEMLEKIYLSSEKTRKYFLWTLIVSLLVFILPLIGLMLVIPRFLSIYTDTLEGL